MCSALSFYIEYMVCLEVRKIQMDGRAKLDELMNQLLISIDCIVMVLGL